MNPERVDQANASPPARPERWLRAALPEGVVGESILGDLHQELEEIAAARGRLRARLWYWLAALEIVWSYRLRSWRQRLPFRFRRPESPAQATFMLDLISDFRYGLRMLRSHKMISLMAILTIAVGVGMTVYTFSTVYGSVLRGVPLPDRGRLLQIRHAQPEGTDNHSVSFHDFLEYRERLDSFEELGALYSATLNLADEEAPPERYQGSFVSANALEMLGVPPAHGRLFLPGEDQPGADPVLILSWDVWQSRFAGDRDVIGRSVRANGRRAEIVGVMPEGFRFPFNHDAWMPFHLDADRLGHGDGPQLDVFGYLRPGASLAEASAEVRAVSDRLEERFPDTHYWNAYALPFEDVSMPPSVTAPIKLQLLAVLGVLLVACANVANLLLARSTARSREVAIRGALGASRIRIIRQLLVESLVIASIGGVIGIGIAHVAITLFNGAIESIFRPYWIVVRIDAPALAVALGATLAAAVLSGILPALRATSRAPGSMLADDARTSTGKLGGLASGLVVAEIAVSAALLVLAGLMVQSLVNLSAVDLGFRTEGILTGRVSLMESDYPSRQERRRFFLQLRERLETTPGIEATALATHLPGLGAMRLVTAVEGVEYDAPGDYPSLNVSVVSSGFFETLDVPLLEGRTLRPRDAEPEAEPVAVVTRSLADRFFPGSAIGQRLRIGRESTSNPWIRIVGVVSDLHVGGGVGGLGNDRIRPESLYVSLSTLDLSGYHVVIRTSGPPSSAVPSLREAVTALDPDMPVYEIAPLDRAIEASTWAFGLFGGMFSSLGGVALFLAVVGLYGVMAFSVARRKREVGIRMALGAGAGSVVWMVVRKALNQLAVGLAIGLTIGWLMSGPLSAITFGVQPGDPTVFAVIFVVLGLTGLAASLLPARRATRVDPSSALRAD